eukprot:TRINITY_DN963_c0_g2_i1.p1 TRINITY_DN963_c0_g2~~TRINITY_DN963_c0_g2_i1.p1  ORF type:complete len:258 (-),score=49.80 TRINITY_DN963_c0_g2_i1:18-701(-)
MTSTPPPSTAPTPTPFSLVENQKQATAMYDGMAEQYSSMMDGELSKRLYTHFLPLFNRLVDPTLPVVDVGCGTGECLQILTSLSPTRPLYGVDPSEGMVAVAKKKLKNAQFFEGFASSLPTLPCGEGGLGGILSTFVIHHLMTEELAPTFVNWASHLRPNGTLLLASWIGDGSDMDYGEFASYKAVQHPLQNILSALDQANLKVETQEITEDAEFGMSYVTLVILKK